MPKLSATLMLTGAKSQTNQWVLTGICVSLTATVWLANEFNLLWLKKPLRDAETYAQETLYQNGRKTPANTNLVLVGFERLSYTDGFSELPDSPGVLDSDGVVDSKSRALALLREDYPWSREMWALLVERLMQAGAKGVLFDIVFKKQMENDERLAEVMRKYRGRVAICYIYGDSEGDTGEGLVYEAPNNTLVPLPPEDLFYDDRVAFATIWPGDDKVVREARFRVSETSASLKLDLPKREHPEDRMQYSLAARALQMLGRADAIPPKEFGVLFRYTDRPQRGFPYHKLNEVFSERTWRTRYQGGAFFKDKLVLVGPIVELLKDYHRTPMAKELMPGPEVHLNIVNAALHGEFLRPMTNLAAQLTILLAGLVSAGLCWLIVNAWRRFLIQLALGFAYGLVALYLFNQHGLIVALGIPLIVFGVCAVGTVLYDFVSERKARQELRKTMDLYFSPKVSAYVLANPGSMEARSAEVTLLLTDLRNSTPLAEMLGPAGMFSLLNHVFEVETNAVMAEDGALEHFLGDQFLTYWGAPQPQPDGPNQALRAALELIKGLEAFKATQPPEVKALFGYGVALHCGSVLFGNKGSAKRLDFGLVGDTVNEAARIESLTKYYGVTLLVSRECFAHLTNPAPHRLLDRVIVKSKSTPVELFEIENPRTPANYAELVREWDAAFANYTAGKFAEARPVFAKLAEQFNDGPSKLMIHRCDELTAYPPTDWKGVWRMESK
jgi:adenylate cyclase